MGGEDMDEYWFLCFAVVGGRWANVGRAQSTSSRSVVELVIYSVNQENTMICVH